MSGGCRSRGGGRINVSLSISSSSTSGSGDRGGGRSLAMPFDSVINDLYS